jgi:CubicO group peptidase (beta-lactamase class C family)
MPDDTITLTATATDDGLPSGSALTYKWVVVSGPPALNGGPSAIIASPTTLSTAVRLAGGAGQYVFSFSANDGALDSAPSTVTVNLGSNPNLYPAPSDGTVDGGWQTSTPAAENLNVTQLDVARDYSLQAGVLSPGGTPRKEAGYIIRHGKLVYRWGTEAQLYEMKSTTKSMGGLALFLALDEGKLALADKAAAKLPNIGLSDPAVTPANGTTTANFGDITVLQLATHTAGFSKLDVPTNVTRTLEYVPGTTWAYSDQGLNWLADVLTQTYNQDLDELMYQRVFTPLGIRGNATSSLDLVWRTNQARTSPLNAVTRRELASGINTNVNAMARVGLLMLRKGAWGNQQLLSNSAVETAHTPPPEVASATIADATNYPDATTNYGILWWTNKNGALNKNPAFGTGVVPTDAYWAWGLHETFIIVIPSLDMVVVRAADTAGWHATNPDDWNADYDVLAPFLRPIAAAVTGP